MNLTQLELANKLAREIENCKSNIEKSKYTQSENVEIRETYLKVNGLDGGIEIPKSLFRSIGKLILSEYEKKLSELEKEFQAL